MGEIISFVLVVLQRYVVFYRLEMTCLFLQLHKLVKGM
ncbi:hypothetical protein APHNP_0599 [Anaplasma phagocytophilum str. ApNP]|uniref:Uncharacterized protein n=3 Tax=Anaplasma phagocytophilum TaxID=948 RepID=A0A0F3N5I1_ANAPH|nr:hypothetical protein EPHNCH_1391 [Anaplasma phagocytophilum str. NCH-1]KJV64245.1 hypothetical protein APHMUC_0801 [Anaplasma phagocytophilum str. ApMUC09]KJV66689.1 hypothetical protein APHNP_0599 [Anaplasma phagocytophilum str. ApNP]